MNLRLIEYIINKNPPYNNITEFLNKTKPTIKPPNSITTIKYIIRPRPTIKCVDGFHVSIQANEFTFCIPSNNDGPWSHIELSFPSEQLPKLFNKFIITNNKYIYTQVPICLVDSLLDAHGGIACEI